MEVFLLSRAVKSNKIDLGRVGFLYEVNRHLPLQRFDSKKNNKHHAQAQGAGSSFL